MGYETVQLYMLLMYIHSENYAIFQSLQRHWENLPVVVTHSGASKYVHDVYM